MNILLFILTVYITVIVLYIIYTYSYKSHELRYNISINSFYINSMHTYSSIIKFNSEHKMEISMRKIIRNVSNMLQLIQYIYYVHYSNFIANVRYRSNYIQTSVLQILKYILSNAPWSYHYFNNIIVKPRFFGIAETAINPSPFPSFPSNAKETNITLTYLFKSINCTNNMSFSQSNADYVTFTEIKLQKIVESGRSLNTVKQCISKLIKVDESDMDLISIYQTDSALLFIKYRGYFNTLFLIQINECFQFIIRICFSNIALPIKPITFIYYTTKWWFYAIVLGGLFYLSVFIAFFNNLCTSYDDSTLDGPFFLMKIII